MVGQISWVRPENVSHRCDKKRRPIKNLSSDLEAQYCLYLSSFLQYYHMAKHFFRISSLAILFFFKSVFIVSFNRLPNKITKQVYYRLNSDSKGDFAIYSSANVALLLHPYGNDENSFDLTEKVRLSAPNAQILVCPNIYELNDKRFEKRWLEYLIHYNLSSIGTIIALDTGSSEAVLRYAESNKLNHIILIDPFDLYTSGERHGRDYRYSLILKNIKSVSVITTKDTLIKSYNTLKRELNSVLNKSYLFNSNNTEYIDSMDKHQIDQVDEFIIQNIMNILQS